jgi:N utilization substance protein B
MKTSQDPRHKRRQRLVQELFSVTFHNQPTSIDTKQILENQTILDEKIQKAAPDFPLEKINKIDLAILRLATYELLVEQKEPKNVIIDEAVELAKEFGNDTSPSFINGVLGHIVTHG